MQRAVRSQTHKHHATTIVVLVTCVSLGGCGAYDEVTLVEDQVSHQTGAIVNGRTDPDHVHVGAILQNGGMCTATLVGLRTVLTASHCVTPGGKHTFFLGNKYWSVTSVHRHPGYRPPSTDNDIAVALLEDSPPVTPGYISTLPPQQGQELTLVGYGATSHQGGGSGTKRVATNRVAYLTNTRIVINGSTGDSGNLCFGDSGGPTFASLNGHEVQVGVHSTISGECGTQGHDTRVDVFADWIDEVAGGDVAKDGNPSPLADTEPPSVDIVAPDHDAELPPGSFMVRATVTDDVEVGKVELIVDEGVSGHVTQPPYEFVVETGPGRHNIAVVAEDHKGNRAEDRIVIHVMAPADFGEACLGHSYCASGLCAAHSELESAYCSQRCDPAAMEPCPGGADCLPAGADMNVCGPTAAALGITDEAERFAEDGACSIGGGEGASGWGVLLLAVLLGLVRRRRR